ncbi:MAG: threonylcarbamoyl-AMP synthase [Anaerolineae bacterium]|nr:threonylcarbamoyl-AMP synthase [Anaerolineae bacterium]
MTYSAETQVLHLNAQHPEAHLIKQAAERIRAGGLVAFPTETVYGLGANGFDAVAVEHIFTAKARPTSDPIILHLSSRHQLELVAKDIPQLALQLAQAFWPGPLTLVLKRQPRVPTIVTAGLDTVAVRVPSHPVALALLKAADVPIAAPSANRFSRPSPTTAQHVLEDLEGCVDLVLDGGATSIGVESTVLDLTQATPTILRPGGALIEPLRVMIPNLQIKQRFVGTEESKQGMTSPGMLLKHYSPNAELMLFTGPDDAKVVAHMQAAIQRLVVEGKSVGVLTSEEDRPYFARLPIQLAELGPRTDLEMIARNLFAGMRTLDFLGVDVILVKSFVQEGLGLAIWDRLIRAAEGKVITIPD